MRRLYMTLRTEHRAPGKVGLGVGLGVFVGCSPFWGVHLPIAVLLGTLFRLNRVIVYASAYIGNPLTVGPILFTEIQLGHRVLHGGWLPVTLADAESLGVLGIFTNLLTGSLVLGAVLGGLLGVAAWLISRAGGHHESYRAIGDAIVVRFAEVSIRDAEAARARLVRDPIYPFLIDEDVLGSGARILDLGCGRGLIGVLVGLLTRASMSRSYLGVDQCDRYIRAARQALEDFPGCAVQTFDLRDFDPPAADVVVVNDVLRFLPFASQDALLRRLARALPPGARLFVREKDASGGWRFATAAFWDAAKIVVPGHPRHGTHHRRAGDLRNALIAAGFSVRDRTVQRAASPAWVLLEAVRHPAAVERG
jgi:uncharacterized protein (DUF2062 family)/2-polyprenyl-3-methyl-5-hydroxy-6-metoxy-1,4-benzoquinol methylase